MKSWVIHEGSPLMRFRVIDASNYTWEECLAMRVRSAWITGYRIAVVYLEGEALTAHLLRYGDIRLRDYVENSFYVYDEGCLSSREAYEELIMNFPYRKIGSW